MITFMYKNMYKLVTVGIASFSLLEADEPELTIFYLKNGPDFFKHEKTNLLIKWRYLLALYIGPMHAISVFKKCFWCIHFHQNDLLPSS